MTLIKLLRKYLIIAMLFVLVIGCVSHFFIFRYFIHYSTDNMLLDQQERIENYVAKHDTLSLAWDLVLKPARIEKVKIHDQEKYSVSFFKDTVLYSEETGSLTPYRQLYFVVSYKNESHLVNINQPTMESDDLFYAIIASLLVIVALFLIFIYIISFLLKRNVWKPMNINLQKLKKYNLKVNARLDLKNSGIEEFDQINAVIMRMVHKINKDYENTRIFTEDASHEMQTPLSIIKSKVDLLIQHVSTDNNPAEVQAVSVISRAVNRLSRLNRSLLLISKINNNQYESVENLNIRELVQVYLDDMEELIIGRSITVNYSAEDCICQMNPVLGEILVTNLLSNAIRHNIDAGRIDIRVESDCLTISNTCLPLNTDEEFNLFGRMVKHGNSEESSGLGLNIVKSICDHNGFEVDYSFPSPDIFMIVIIFNLF